MIYYPYSLMKKNASGRDLGLGLILAGAFIFGTEYFKNKNGIELDAEFAMASEHDCHQKIIGQQIPYESSGTLLFGATKGVVTIKSVTALPELQTPHDKADDVMPVRFDGLTDDGHKVSHQSDWSLEYCGRVPSGP